MKRVIMILIAFMLCLVGCVSQTTNNKDDDLKKKSKLEIYSMQDDLLSTIDEQDTINNLLNNDDWLEVNELPDDLIPEYKLLVHQEKTLLAGQNPNEERDYELIETIMLFQDSAYATEVISSDAVKNMIPSDALTFYFELPDSTIEKIKNVLNSDLLNELEEE